MIRRLSSGGHGAAPVIATRSDDRSYRSRTAAGSRSSRVSMVGTNWACVTRYRSIAASAPSASKRSWQTTVPPSCWTANTNRKGAVW